MSDNDLNLETDLDKLFTEDSVGFKPVTKGLGFHHKHDSKPTIPTYSVNKGTQNRFQNAPKSSGVPSSFSSSEAKSHTTVASGLEAFYQTGNTSVETLQEPSLEPKVQRTTKRKAVQTEAKASVVFGAWAIDATLITSLNIALHGIFLLMTGMSIESAQVLLADQDFIIFSGVLFSILYLIYFSFFDLGQTIGKGMLGIRLVSEKAEKLTMTQTLTRAGISLASLVLLFFPLVLDFHGKISETKIIED